MNMPRERVEKHHRLLPSEKNSRTRVKDVKVVRGAEVGSDRYLVC